MSSNSLRGFVIAGASAPKQSRGLPRFARNPRSTARVIAQAVGITERTTHKIIAELEEAGYISRKRVGRKNQYRINSDLPLRHPSHGEVMVGELLQILARKKAELAKEQMKLPIGIP